VGSTFFFDWDWAAADRAWTEVIASPDALVDRDVLLAFSLARWVLGRPADAVTMLRKARTVDPISAALKVREADILTQMGRTREAVQLYDEVIRDEPKDPRAYYGVVEARRKEGRFDDAVEAWKRAAAAAEDDSLRDELAEAAGEAGFLKLERRAAELQLAELNARAARAYVSPLDIARANAQLGRAAETFEALERALVDRSPGLVFLKVDRAWDPLRNDERFRRTVARVGLP
jgi:tetratricopeptide (TPR) repeat protein